MISPEKYFHENLISWFNENKREFPWRRGNPEPFVMLVTELLLQRTKADSIANFFPVIINKYSSPKKILSLDKDEISNDLKILGLQKRRAESLISISTQLSRFYDDKVPLDEKELMKLNGVGRYIARAVLCFVAGMPVSIVDGNVTRVLCRYFALPNKGDNRRNKHIWIKAQELIDIDRKKVKSFNWGIIDFAALVCTSRKPSCSTCPISRFCSFNTRQEEYK
ncbi:MAG: hypothetical protein ACTSVI_15875 [Promethearchaeota archaeon]